MAAQACDGASATQNADLDLFRHAEVQAAQPRGDVACAQGGTNTPSDHQGGRLRGRDVAPRWEQEITSETPQLNLAQDTALAPLITARLKRSLRPIFQTDVERIALPVRFGRSELEIAFDHGHIRSGRRRTAISEIELELKSGDRADLARLAREVREGPAGCLRAADQV